MRRFIEPYQPHADSNIHRHYAIERAAWVWHPRPRGGAPVVLAFRRTFTLDRPGTLDLHVSGDERYELSLDGEHVSAGPHRSDVAHWAFASFTIELGAGEHRLDALVWRLGELAPAAQMSHAGGFLLACEPMPQLDTGQPGWEVRRVPGRSFAPCAAIKNAYHVVGPEETIAPAAQRDPEPWAPPAIVRGPVKDHATGIQQPGWRVYPSPLPEMLRRPRSLGTVRAAQHGEAAEDRPVDPRQHDPALARRWQAMLDGGGRVEVPPHTAQWVIADLGRYTCGYPELTLTGSPDGYVRLLWAEALYEADPRGAPTAHKGDRAAIDAKHFIGFGDQFHAGGDTAEGEGRAAGEGEGEGEGEGQHQGDGEAASRPLWWRAGRMVRLQARAGDRPLVIHRARLLETRYPLDPQGHWQSDDPTIDPLLPIAVRAMQMCSHETYMDCPYYEQLMYVGDGRLEMLTQYVLSDDDRLTRRAIELFDFSRMNTGIVAERYPSDPFQLSTTFAMIWVLTLRDYAWWRDDRAWVRRRLIGARALLDHVLAARGDDALLHDPPGWSFLDWVPRWELGSRIPGAEGQPLAIVNLLLLLALRAMDQLERAHGEAEYAARYARLARAHRDHIVQAYWDDDAGLLRDAPVAAGGESFSEHAQCLALLGEALAPPRRERCFAALIQRPDLWRATIYFSFYLFETLQRFGRGDLLHARLDFWKDLARQGFTTTVEQPEPSRSDCHAWGAHPLFHLHASLAGVRPAAPGFAKVVVAPSPGPLRRIDAALPHPRGRVEAKLAFEGEGRCEAEVTLPPGVGGVLRWQGRDHPLRPGDLTTIHAEAK